MVVLVHELDVEYPDGDRAAERIRSTLVVEGEAGGFTAMSRTVGLPVAIAVKLLLRGELSLTGCLIPTHPSIYEPVLRRDRAGRPALHRDDPSRWRVHDEGDTDAHARRDRPLAQGERAAPADPPGPLRPDPRVRCAARSASSAATASRSASPTTSWPAASAAWRPRDELLDGSDVVLLPKPLPEDLRELREGGILWGWPHCVQQHEITQVAIDRRLTLIAWEAMFRWKRRRARDARLRSQQRDGRLLRRDSRAGPRRQGRTSTARQPRPCVLSHGSVSRGAIYALLRPRLRRHHGLHAAPAVGRARQDPRLPLRADDRDESEDGDRRSSRKTAPRRPLIDVAGRGRRDRQRHPAGHRPAADVPARGRGAAG